MFAPSGSKPLRTSKTSKKAGFSSGLRFEKKEERDKRQKTIEEVENQLLNADIFSIPISVPTNLQSKENLSSTEMTEKRVVQPGSKDAPKFRSTHPEELRRFIRRMEDLWDEAKLEEKDLVKSIGKYADQNSEEEWSAFDSFEEGTWEEFKEELIANYPEAAAAERGTPARIRQICAETAKIRLGDTPALYSFRRAFLSEARKLQKAPAAMSNRELVELFIGCLSEGLGSAVLQFLGNRMHANVDKKEVDKISNVESSQSADKAPEGPSKKKEAIRARRPEDRYDLEDVCKAAIQVSENSQGMFDLMKKEPSPRSEARDVLMFGQPVSDTKVLTEKMEELEGTQALERDRIVSMNKTIESRIVGLEELIKTLLAQSQSHVGHEMCKGDCKGGSHKMHEVSSSTTQQRWGAKSLDNERCFWCSLLGHFQADCEDLKNQIKLGNVKINHEGKLRLRDGSFIPKFPADACLKERVEKHYAKKPSQYFYGEYEENDPVTSTSVNGMSQFLGSNNDSDKRTIAQLKAELELRKREEAIDLRQKMLEQNEKKFEQASGSTRTTSILELINQLTEEDLAAIKTAKSGFN